MSSKIVAYHTVFAVLFITGCRNSADYLKQGDDLAAKGKLGDAIIAYNNAIKKDAKAVAPYQRLAEIEGNSGNWMNAYRLLAQAGALRANDTSLKIELANAALAAYGADDRRPDSLRKQIDKIVDELPQDRDSDRIRIRGLLARLDGKIDTAISEFEKLRRSGPVSSSVLINLMAAYSETGQPKKLEDLALSSISAQPHLLAAYDLLFKTYLTENRAGDAEALLKKKLANNPTDPSVYLQLIEFYAVSTNRQRDLEVITQKFTTDKTNFPTAWRNVGELFERLNRPQQAIEAYIQGQVKDKANEGLYLRSVADLLWRLDRKAEALEKAQLAVAADPKNQEGKRLLASFELAEGKIERLDQVIEVYSQVLKDRPNDPIVNNQLGMAYRAKRDYARATSYFQAALRANPRFPQANLALAEIAAQSGNNALASKYLADILAVDPENPRIRFLQAAALRNLGRYAESAKITTALLARDPNNPDFQVESALLSLSSGKLDEATVKFEKIRKATPNDKRAIAGLMSAYAAGGKQDAFKAVATEALQQDPKNPFLLEAIASNALQRRDLKLAETTYIQLLEVDPSNTTAVFQLGLLAMTEQKYDVALAHFKKVQQLNPADPQASMNEAAALHYLGRFDEAIPAYLKAMKLNPKDPGIWNNLAFCYAQKGMKLDEALDLSTRSTQAQPKSETFLDTLGYVYLRKKMPDSAIPIFSKLGRANPNNTKYPTLLAQAYLDKGDVSRARQLVDQIVRKGDSSPELEALQKALATAH